MGVIVMGFVAGCRCGGHGFFFFFFFSPVVVMVVVGSGLLI